MFERFTDAARQAVAAAEGEARDMNSGHIGTEHLLIALAAEPQGLGGRILRHMGAVPDDLRADARRHAGPSAIDPDALATLGIDFDEVRRRVEATFGAGALSRGRECEGHIPFAPSAKNSLELSLRSAQALGDQFIGSEHLLLGIARADRGMAAQILRDRGIDVKRLEAAVVQARRAA